MAKNLLKYAAIAVFALSCISARAQFYLSGSEPWSQKWSSVSTQSYRIIYPRGLDSLAARYAVRLEKARPTVAASCGFAPNGMYRSTMPVILHTNIALSNGSVVWTPRRMELYTTPDPYAPDPSPWVDQLVLHESRHVAQLQYGAGKPFRWANVLCGELAVGALSAIYCGPDFFEGDAVTAETALSSSGRGRTADFLEYWRACAAEGQKRDWWQWRYGSVGRFTPDYYRAGYVAIAGIRTLYDFPDLVPQYYARIRDHKGFAPFNMSRLVRERTGRTFTQAFDEVCDTLYAEWEREAAGRGPFTQAERITQYASVYSAYTGTAVLGDDIWAIRSSMTEPTRLVKISKDGTESTVRVFSGSQTSPLQVCGESLVWSEYRSDTRWEFKSTSDIVRLEGGKVRTLLSGGHYYNPSVSPDRERIAVTSYDNSASSSLLLLDSADGTVLERIAAPGPDFQIIESAWIGQRIFVSGLTEGGIGIWEATAGFSPVLEPLPVKIRQLGSRGALLTLVCDRTGVNEIYTLDPDSGRIVRLTSSRIGASDYATIGDTIYFAQPDTRGRMLYKAEISPVVQLDKESWRNTHVWQMADELSAQEDSLALEPAREAVGEVRDCTRGARLMHFHSWVPLFINYDSVGSLSMDDILTSANLGATGFFQNDLGTSYGWAGVRLLDSNLGFRPSFHARYTFTGFYPVLEASLSVGDRLSIVQTVGDVDDGNGGTRTGITEEQGPNTSARLLLSSYVPLNFSSSGIRRGLVPTVTLSLSNDRLDGNPTDRVSASLRGYIMQSTPSSCLYPKLGIGAEVGYSSRPFDGGVWCSNAYAYLYGYLPGIGDKQGLRLSAMVQHRFSDGIFAEVYANLAPRGMSAASSLMCAYPWQAKFSADYAIPFARLDWGGLGAIAYVRNLELTPHFDWSGYTSSKSGGGALTSAGADLSVVLGNLAWVPYTTRVGVSWSLNGGSAFEDVKENGIPVGRHYLGFIFSVDL